MPLPDLNHPTLTLYPTAPRHRWLVGGSLIGAAGLGGWFLWKRAGPRFLSGDPSTEQIVVASLLALIGAGALLYMLVQVRYRVRRAMIDRQYTLLGVLPFYSRLLTPLAAAELIDEGYATEGTVFADPGDTYIDEDGMEQQKLLKAGRIGRFRIWIWHDGHKMLLADDLEDRQEVDALLQLQRWAQAATMQGPPPPRRF